jgi:hypothetical protein
MLAEGKEKREKEREREKRRSSQNSTALGDCKHGGLC